MYSALYDRCDEDLMTWMSSHPAEPAAEHGTLLLLYHFQAYAYIEGLGQFKQLIPGQKLK